MISALVAAVLSAVLLFNVVDIILMIKHWLAQINDRRRGDPERFQCHHRDELCDKYGCPDDPEWKGDRR